MEKQLLIDYIPFSTSKLTLSESKSLENGRMRIKGKLQEANVKNGNGRVYPEMVLRREVENYQKLIRENRALGELDHPDQSVINLKNVSHLVTELWWNGKDVMGKVKILETPSGKILRSLVESGVKLGISSRGLGKIGRAHV